MRRTWDETWLGVAGELAGRSLCVNSQVGAVAVSADNRFSWPGYNGPPAGLGREEPCSQWCPRAMGEGAGTSDYSACESIHAEVNVLLRADASLLVGGSMYVTRAPCINCARVIANSGLARVVCRVNAEDDPWRSSDAFSYLNKCGLEAGYVG